MVNDDDDDVQTLENFYNEFTNDDSWSLITPYLGPNVRQSSVRYVIIEMESYLVIITEWLSDSSLKVNKWEPF